MLFILSIGLTVLYYPKVTGNLNSVFFSTSGDGLVSYYSMMYHVQHDDNMFYQQNMNHPYGENILFTAGQPLLSNILKLFYNDKDSVKAVLFSYNLLMLLSIAIAPLFLFLIFTQMFRLPVWPALIFAIGIAFLSPQIDRLPGHFTLSFVFAIPCFIYLLYRFSLKQNYSSSIAIAVFTMLVSSFHLYYLGFFGIIALVYFLTKFFADKDFSTSGILKTLSHFVIQIITPFVFISILSGIGVEATDRTNLPWGYFLYTSNFSGVFLQSESMPAFISKNIHLQKAEWEGISYVGLFSVIIIISIIISLIAKMFNIKISFETSKNEKLWLLVLLTAGLLGLLYSFAIPLKYSDVLFANSGPLKQMRGVGRFAWLFYYTINIIAVVWLLKMLNNFSGIKSKVILFLAASIVLYEAHINNRNMQEKIYNEFPALVDVNNEMEENKWINSFDFDEYQAIIPLPFFHIGSENYTIEPENSKIREFTYKVSLKSGLPTLAISGSRTSRSRSMKLYELFLTPFQRPAYIDDLQSSKSFLVIKENNANLNEGEYAILSNAKLISHQKKYSLYRISPEDLDRRQQFVNEFNSEVSALKENNPFVLNNWWSETSLPFVYDYYSYFENNNGFLSGSAFRGRIRNYNRIYEGVFDTNGYSNWVASFWFGDFHKDVYPRSTVEIIVETDKNKHFSYYSIHRQCRQISGNWALIEIDFSLEFDEEIFQRLYITVFNHEIYDKNALLFVDELLLKPAGTNLYRLNDNDLRKNNRMIPSL